MANNKAVFFIRQYCGEESEPRFIRLRMAAKARGLNYDSCYAAVIRLRLWSCQHSRSGVVPEDSEIVQHITDFPDGAQVLLQALQDAKVITPVANGFYLENWHEDQDECVTTPGAARAKKQAAGWKSGSVRRGEADGEAGGEANAHAGTPAPHEHQADDSTALLDFEKVQEKATAKLNTCSAKYEQNRTEQTRPDQTREEQTKQARSAAGVGLSPSGSVFAAVGVNVRAMRAVREVWRGQIPAEKLFELWQKTRGPKPVSEEAVLDLVGLCIEAPAKKRSTCEAYVIGMTKAGGKPSEEALRRASAICAATSPV